MPDMTELDDLLTEARDSAKYLPEPYDQMTRRLVIAIEQLLEPVLEKTVDEIYEQNQKILTVLQNIGDFVSEEDVIDGAAVEDVSFDLDNVVPLPVIAAPKTGVHLRIYDGDNEVTEVHDIDGVQVLLQNGTIPFAYEADGEMGHRFPLYYDNEGIAHRFDDRKAERRGW